MPPNGDAGPYYVSNRLVQQDHQRQEKTSKLALLAMTRGWGDWPTTQVPFGSHSLFFGDGHAEVIKTPSLMDMFK